MTQKTPLYETHIRIDNPVPSLLKLATLDTQARDALTNLNQLFSQPCSVALITERIQACVKVLQTFADMHNVNQGKQLLPNESFVQRYATQQGRQFVRCLCRAYNLSVLPKSSQITIPNLGGALSYLLFCLCWWKNVLSNTSNQTLTMSVASIKKSKQTAQASSASSQTTATKASPTVASKTAKTKANPAEASKTAKTKASPAEASKTAKAKANPAEASKTAKAKASSTSSSPTSSQKPEPHLALASSTQPPNVDWQTLLAAAQKRSQKATIHSLDSRGKQKAKFAQFYRSALHRAFRTLLLPTSNLSPDVSLSPRFFRELDQLIEHQQSTEIHTLKCLEKLCALPDLVRNHNPQEPISDALLAARPRIEELLSVLMLNDNASHTYPAEVRKTLRPIIPWLNGLAHGQYQQPQDIERTLLVFMQKCLQILITKKTLLQTLEHNTDTHPQRYCRNVLHPSLTSAPCVTPSRWRYH